MRYLLTWFYIVSILLDVSASVEVRRSDKDYLLLFIFNVRAAGQLYCIYYQN